MQQTCTHKRARTCVPFSHFTLLCPLIQTLYELLIVFSTAIVNWDIEVDFVVFYKSLTWHFLCFVEKATEGPAYLNTDVIRRYAPAKYPCTEIVFTKQNTSLAYLKCMYALGTHARACAHTQLLFEYQMERKTKNTFSTVVPYCACSALKSAVL